MIDGSEAVAVASGDALMLGLDARRREVLLAACREFCGRGRRRDPAGASVVADIVDRHVVDDGPVNVDVAYDGRIDVRHGRVVAERTTEPAATDVADADVTEAVIYPAVVPDEPLRLFG
jgi:hypothetical protein